jgi:DNA-binding NarL/FixJ family response regulator
LVALRAGVSGYLLKSMNPLRLPHALWDVHQGAVAMPRALLAGVLSQFHERNPSRRRTVGGPEPALTAREWQILQLLEAGESTAAIAQRLSISAATVRSHRRRLAEKLRQQAASHSPSLSGSAG